MKIYDFEYNGILLSDKGFIVCSFDSSGLDTISAGANITMETVPTMHGSKYELISSEYEECISATFQICKSPCIADVTGYEISNEEIRDIMRWLNRKGFHKFVVIDDEYIDTYYESTFNVSRIENGGVVVGFELEMITNSPFAFAETDTIRISTDVDDEMISIFNKSDEEGYIYPKTTIKIKKDGDFQITNHLENRTTLIRNCKSGETITMEYPIILSSLDSHKMQNDFNWRFFRIARTFEENENVLNISLPCDIEISYSPIVKLSV